MNTAPSFHDAKELERRRAEAYREIPLLRQQALEEALRGVAVLLASVLEAAARSLRSVAGRTQQAGAAVRA